MNLQQIINNVKESLIKENIGYTDIYILETKWGYVIQTEYAKPIDYKESKKTSFSKLYESKILKSNEKGLPLCKRNDSFISLWYNDGQIFFPFTKISRTETSGIYETISEDIASKYHKINTQKMIEEDKNEHQEFFNLLPYRLDSTGNINFCEKNVLYKELDDNHFIISIKLDKVLTALFYITDDNKIIYYGNIPGDIYSFNQQLAQNKTLLVTGNNNNFLFSWEKNTIISDKWTRILTNKFYIQLILNAIKNMLPEVRKYFLDLTEKCGGFLGLLELKSEYNEEKIQFFAVLKTDGTAITDLMYITDTYEIKTMKLIGEPIGTLDMFKEEAQKRLNRRTMMVENNKKQMLNKIAMLTTENIQRAQIANQQVENDDLKRKRKK